MQLAIFCPKPSTPLATTLKAGSAIVGDPTALTEGRVCIYYEGNVYNAENMRYFSERLLHAAGRLTTKYPTVAQAFISLDELDEVGVYNTDAKQALISDPETLRAWCPDADVLTGPIA